MIILFFWKGGEYPGTQFLRTEVCDGGVAILTACSCAEYSWV